MADGPVGPSETGGASLFSPPESPGKLGGTTGLDASPLGGTGVTDCGGDDVAGGDPEGAGGGVTVEGGGVGAATGGGVAGEGG